MSDAGEAVAAQQPDWELSKENFQPLKAGRKPGGLTVRPAATEALTTDQQREKFEKSIAEYQGDDPLELWLSYIKWTRETFPAGGHKADLLPLLERATRSLQGLSRYTDDVRYLRVWVQYADCLPDPTDVFKFLKEQGIGQGHALFYEAHAALLERRGAFAAADNVYQQGVNRGAEPLDRLKAKHEGFQHRMARRIQRKAAEQAAAPSAVEPPDHPERQTLAILGGRRSVRSAGLGATGKRKAVATPGRDNAPAGGSGGGNSGLEIFVDEEFGGPAASAPPALAGAGPSTSTAAAGIWNSLPSFEASRKENTQKASSWAGQRMKQVPTLSTAPAPALAIPLDPEFAEAEAAAAAKAAGEPSLRQRLDRGGLEEQLAHDPLRMHRTPAVPPAAAAPAAAKAPREEVLACDVAALKGEGGDELCFEELRARAWAQRAPGAVPVLPESAADSDVEMEVAEEDEPAPPEPIVLEPSENEAKSTPFDQPAPAEAPAAPAVEVPAAPAAFEPSGSASAPLEAMPSSSDVTLTTRGAFDAINAAFGGRFGGDAPALALEPTMTISTRDAFAAINSMFGSKSSSFNSDVTMNTKAAFDALNAAFGGGAKPAQPAESAPQPTASPALFVRQDTSMRSDAAGAALEALQEVHPALAGSSGGLDIREDTVFIAGPGAGPSDATAAAPTPAGGGFDLGIREDTVFINPHAAGPSTATTAAPTPGGFSIREDTIFINRGPVGAAPSTAGPTPGGFSIREDTIFINRGPGASAALPDEEEGPTPAPGGLLIREDTIFINRGAAGPAGAGAPCPVGATPTVALGALDKENTAALLGAGDDDDTIGVGGGMASKWGFAPGADDTLAFPADGLTALLGGGRRGSGGSSRGGSSAAASPRLPSLSTGLTEELRGIDLAAAAAAPFDSDEVTSPAPAAAVAAAAEVYEVYGDENAEPRGRSTSRAPRDVRDPAVAPLALRALSPDALAKLDGSGSEDGAVFEENPEAEAALASSPPRGLADDFQVYADPEDGPAAVVVEPFSSGFQAHMLGMLSPPVAEWPGVISVSADEEATALAAFKRAGRGGGSGPQEVSLGDARFTVGASLGSGAYATVYAATAAATGEEVALKVEAPACPWEWYVCRVVGGRVPADRAAAFVAPTALALGPGASVTAMPRGRHGSLQDLLNAYLTRGERPDEALVARLGAGLLRALGDLHTARVLHNDIKPDNLLVSLSNEGVPTIYVQLIDFGRAVDLALLPPGSVLAGDCGTEGFRCVEMREGRPWLWQADAYGAAGCLHTLLFGAYMDVERVVDGESGEARLRIKTPLKRYWQRGLWDRVFSTLLNWSDASAPPPWGELADEMEVWLEGDRDAARREQAELSKLVAWI